MNKIEWTDDTWNPVTGCRRVSKGCENCYAENIANRFWGDREFTDVQCHEDRLEQPLRWKKPRRVFVNSMSDLFHEDVPFEFIDKVFAIMALCEQHTFQILTKRPERMREYFKNKDYSRRGAIESTRVLFAPEGFNFSIGIDWPLPNVWLGVSVEDQKTADERIPILLETPATIRFVSAEPLLGAVQFEEIPNGETLERVLAPECWGDCNCDAMYGYDSGCRRNGGDGTLTRRIDWIIVGGESGQKTRPMHTDWVRSIKDQCQDAGVPFFFKQWGEWGPSADHPLVHEELPWSTENGDCQGMCKVGKKKAGRLLDGVIYGEYPQ